MEPESGRALASSSSNQGQAVAQGGSYDPQGRPDSYYEPQAPRYQQGTNDLGVLALGAGLGVGGLGLTTYLSDPNGDSVFSMLHRRFAGERGPEVAAWAQAAKAEAQGAGTTNPMPGPGEEVPAQAAQAANSTPQPSAQQAVAQPPTGGVRPVNLPGQPEATGGPIGNAGLEAEKAAARQRLKARIWERRRTGRW